MVVTTCLAEMIFLPSAGLGSGTGFAVRCRESSPAESGADPLIRTQLSKSEKLGAACSAVMAASRN